MALLLALGAARDLWTAAHPAWVTAVAAPADGHEPRRAEAPPGPPPAADSVRTLDLNHATATQLDDLPGIGPVLAGRILEYRRLHGGFRHVEELLGVVGIGPRLLERLSRRVRVGPVTAN